VPAGATVLGGVDLGRYCAQSGLYAALRFPDTFGWRCSTSPASASGNRLGDQNINVLAACIQQYGTGAASHYSSYTNPSSWFCYR
jgi:enterochelin esterase-like enzyme